MEQKYLMHLFSSGAACRVPDAPDFAVDWEKIAALSKEQTVTLAVGAALFSRPEICSDEAVREMFLKKATASVKRSRLRIARIFALLSSLQESGVDYVLLKGYCFAMHYGLPECRESVDTDILIRPGDEKKAMAFFRAQDFRVMPRKKSEHHFRCFHRELGMFEVHIRFWQDGYDKLLLKSVADAKTAIANAVTVQTELGTFQKLCDTQELLFATMHFIKHFLFKGVTIRRIYDIALLYRAVAERTDTTEYWSVLRSLGFEKTIQTMFCIGRDFLSVPYAGEDVPKDTIEAVLCDCFSDGYNGRKDLPNRLQSYENLVRSRYETRFGKGRAKLFLLWTNFREAFFVVFPSAEELAKGYPRLKKHKSLYPVYALLRIFSRGLRHVKPKPSEDRSDPRAELFENLGLYK